MSLAQASAPAIPKYELIGAGGAPVAVVLGGISADQHICSHPAHEAPGWWERVAGAHRPLDTTLFQLLGCEWLDGGAAPGGRPARAVTTQQQAEALAAVLDELQLQRVHAVVGASYGGMVALAFAAAYPERLQRLVVIGAAHRSHPMITALRTIQRRIVELGLESDRVHEALVLARALGVTTYREAREFASRFDTAPDTLSGAAAGFPVERYLQRQGERFAKRFTPARFLALSLSGDLHHVDPAAITTPATLVAIEHDAIAPRWQIEELAAALAGPVRIADLRTRKGHDGFLTESDALAPILHAALS